MFDEEIVLCGANAYEKKYYLNDMFTNLPESIRNELQIMCVMYTEEVGGVLILKFSQDGRLLFETECAEEDLLYDDIGAELRLKQISANKQELLESLELYYKVFVLGEDAGL